MTSVFESLLAIQKALSEENRGAVRVGLFTARGRKAYPRVVHTFRAWGLSVDEAFFCDGEPKGPFLKAFNADVFFDDSLRNIESAHVNGVPSGHVPNKNGTLAIGDKEQ
jgi:5'-nucleotidase